MNVRFAALPLLILFGATSAQAARAPVALLPSVGTASDDKRRDVDGAFRQALLDADELDLQSPVETRGHLMGLAEMGLVCLPEDVACLVKLGIVANVAWVLVPVVDEPDAGALPIEISAIDVAKGNRARVVDATVPVSDDDAIGAVALRALGLQPALPPELPPDPPPDLPPDPPGEGEGEGEPTEEGLSPGVLVTGIGGAVAGVALVSAVISDLVFFNVIAANKETRESIQPFGVAMWGVTALGLAATGVGIYLLTEEAPE